MFLRFWVYTSIIFKLDLRIYIAVFSFYRFNKISVKIYSRICKTYWRPEPKIQTFSFFIVAWFLLLHVTL